MPGMATNLHHRFENWSRAFYRSGLTEGRLGILLYTVAQICWSRLTTRPVLEETEDYIESTRFSLVSQLGSLKCDCGPQLDAALTQMGHEGAGVLLYLNQEGRGIGLANKMRAYSLQDQGFDTVEANHRLGFEDDERDFRIGAALLRRLGFGHVRLLTNNPAKVRMLETHGIEVVERVPLKVGLSRHNAAYLATKAAKSGHIL